MYYVYLTLDIITAVSSVATIIYIISLWRKTK